MKADDPAGGGKNRWQEGIDAWINGQDDGRYKYPKEYCGQANEVYVEITDPGDKSQVGNEFDFKAKVTANKDIKKVEFFVDGSKKKELTSKPFEYKQNLIDGTYTLKIRAEDTAGNVGEKEIKIGVNKAWDWQPSPSPSPSPSVSATPLSSPP